MDKEKLASLGIEVDEKKYPFPILNIANTLGSASLSLYGGHLLSYAPNGERQLLWISSKSNFLPGKPIRGGVPVCWPWFGPAPQAGDPAHGFARTSMWKLYSAEKLAGDVTRVVISLDDCDCDNKLCKIKFHLELSVTVGTSLELELRAFNTGDTDASYQAALHTYFAVNEAAKITVGGLDKVSYIDKAPDHAGETAVNYGDLEIDREIDRVFSPSQETVTIADPDWRRTIRIEKTGSLSTVVWNPWIAKSKAMADFGDNEYHKMVCVECGNVLADTRCVKPGNITIMCQKISVEKWD